MKQKQCDRFNTLITDALYDGLSEKDKAFFMSHQERCPRCAQEYEAMASVLGVMSQRKQIEPSEAFWDNYLPNLQKKMDLLEHQTCEPEPQETSLSVQEIIKGLQRWWQDVTFKINPRWLLVPGAAFALVVFGVLIGRFLYSPEGQHLMNNPLSVIGKVSPQVTAHFDNIRPLLIDYANYSTPPNQEPNAEGVWVDRDTLQRLTMENSLLKQVVARSNDAPLKQLLEDLNMVLTELSNSDSTQLTQQTIYGVQDILRQNDVLFKMNVYKQTNLPQRKTTRI